MRVSKILFPTAIVLAVLIMLFGAAWLFGPRTVVDTTITFDPGAIGDDLDAYLEKVEARIPGIQPNQHKEIVWADPEKKAKTPSRSSTSMASLRRQAKCAPCLTSSRGISVPTCS